MIIITHPEPDEHWVVPKCLAQNQRWLKIFKCSPTYYKLIIMPLFYFSLPWLEQGDKIISNFGNCNYGFLKMNITNRKNLKNQKKTRKKTWKNWIDFQWLSSFFNFPIPSFSSLIGFWRDFRWLFFECISIFWMNSC